jgi:hypothetical protein
VKGGDGGFPWPIAFVQPSKGNIPRVKERGFLERKGMKETGKN